MSLRGQLVGAARLAPFPERQAVPGIDRAQRGTSDVGEHEAATRCSRACWATCSAAICPLAPRADRIGRFQPAASANIRSAPAAQAGKAQISRAARREKRARRVGDTCRCSMSAS
jgi:hypothetical protein